MKGTGVKNTGVKRRNLALAAGIGGVSIAALVLVRGRGRGQGRRRLRLERGLSQRETARRSGVHRKTIAKLCRDDWTTLDRAVLNALCAGLNLTPETLLGWDEGLRTAERAIVIAETAQSDGARIAAYTFLGHCLADLGHVDEGLGYLRRSADEAEAHQLNWVAVTALAHGFGVATKNARDFRRVPGLCVLAARA